MPMLVFEVAGMAVDGFGEPVVVEPVLGSKARIRLYSPAYWQTREQDPGLSPSFEGQRMDWWPGKR